MGSRPRRCKGSAGHLARSSLPVAAIRRRGLRDEEPASDLEEGRRALRHHGRTSEGARQHPVEGATEALLASADLGPLLEDRHPARELQAVNRPSQEGGPAAAGIEKHHGHFVPRRGHDEPGEAAARAQVDHARRLGPLGSKPTGRSGEPLGVTDLWLQGPGAEESGGAGLGEDCVQRRGGAVPVLGAAAPAARQPAGAMTMWRLGSSPSERVTTPGISLTASCTALRSAGLIASRAFS